MERQFLNRSDRVAVCSRSFSNNQVLRAELLARYDSVTFNESGEQMEGARLVSFLEGHNKAIVGLETIDAELLTKLPALEVVSKYGVGLDKIDQPAMRMFGKRLGWTPGVNRRSVAELVIALAITLLRQVPAANREVLSGQWRQKTGGLLSGRTVGIIGCGHVGKDLVALLKPFGCRIVVNDIRDYPDFFKANEIETMALSELLAIADIVTLHVPLDGSTRGMLDVDRLAQMKPRAILINTARGGLIDEQALKQALADKKIFAAGFDVFECEPPQDFELLEMPNFFATPHIGGSAEEAVLAMGRAAIDGLDINQIPE